MADSLVIGYDKKDDESALVILRPRSPEINAEYDEVGTYFGDVADMIYNLLIGDDSGL